MADNSRHRKLHQDEHEEGGVDEIPEGSLLPQDPTDHSAVHESGGSDELNLSADQIADGSVSNTEFQRLDGVQAPVADKDYVDSKVQGVDWQRSVLEQRNDPPSSPSDGDRYLIGESAGGDWSGEDEKIAEWDGSSSEWEFSTPNDGWTVWIESENKNYVYNDSYSDGEWVTMSSTVSHGSLSDLGSDHHDHYLHVDGRRSMDDDLSLGNHDLVSVGQVDGINVSSHDHTGGSSGENVPNSGLVNDSVTVSAGNALSGGGSVSLGSSVSIDVDEGSISHDNLSGVSEGNHHDAFEALLDESGVVVDPDGDNRIQIDADSTINAEANGSRIVLSTTDEAGVTYHGDLSGLDEDHHDHYLLADGTRSMSGSLNMNGNDLDNVGEIDPDTFVVNRYSQSSEPSLSSGELAIWEDTDNDQVWLIHEKDGSNKFVELSG